MTSSTPDLTETEAGGVDRACPPRAVVTTSGIGVYEWNAHTECLTWDETIASIFGADQPDESPFATWQRRVHPDDRAWVLSAFSTFDEVEAVYRLVMDDGCVRHLLSRVTHVSRGPDGGPVSVTGVMIDVTDSVSTAARLTSMLDSISDGFLTVDTDWRVTYLNRRAEQVLGMDAALMVGRTMWDVFPKMAGTAFEASYRRVLEDRLPVVFEEYYPEPLDMWVEARAQPSDEGMVIYFQDVTARHAQQEEHRRLLASERQAREEAEAARRTAEDSRLELAYQATHDELTGLVSRSEFERVAAQRLSCSTGPVTIMFIDLDRFKLVNDSLGHATGDAVLVEVGRRLRRALQVDQVAARLGGDEFVVLLEDRGRPAAEAVADRLLTELRQPVHVGRYAVSTSASIGLATAEAGTTVATLLRDADVALYRAKDAGRDRRAWFDTAAHEQLLERVSLENDLRDLLAWGSVDLHYQPIYALDDGRLLGVEALARWHHRERGSISPAVFIPLAEDSGLIAQLGADVIRTAAHQAARWAALPGFVVWVNVSGRQLETPGLAQTILRRLETANVAPQRFGVEVTESVLADEAVAVRELLQLSEAGVPIAIDDFGTGYSSLARLAALPISVLKIDRSFVIAMETPYGKATVDVIVHLARSLGMRTVAEGIETSEQLEQLRAAGADSASGYLLGRPAPSYELLPGPMRL